MNHPIERFGDRKRIRHLAIEQLEPRTYLASDVIYISSEYDPSANHITSILQDPTTGSLSFQDPSPQFVITGGNPSSPGIGESIQLDDPDLTVVAKPVNSDETGLRLQTYRDNTTASVGIAYDTAFSGGQVLVGIRRTSDPDSAPWLATQVITITFLHQSPAVDLSLTATTSGGAPIDELHVGDDFVLHVWAQDTRPDPHGVFAAYLNLNWDAPLAAVGGELSFGDHFTNGSGGHWINSKYEGVQVDAGSISKAGGFGGPSEWRANRYEVFSISMHATAAGDLTIASSPVNDGTPTYNILEYGLDSAINQAAIQFGKLSIHIADAAPGQPKDDPTSTPVIQPPTNPVITTPVIQTPTNPIIQPHAVDLSLLATTPDGLPINELHVGDDFVLHVMAQDTRADAHGVFAAYLNLNWDSSLASLSGNTSHGEHFSNGKKDGDAAPGSLKVVGGFGGFSETMANRYEVFSVPLHASAAGDLSIATSSAEDGTPLYWVLEYGLDGEIPPEEIQFETLSLHIASDSPEQTPPGTAAEPTFDHQTIGLQTIVENEISTTTPQTATPTIILTAASNSGASPITVDLKNLLSPEFKAAIASCAAAGPAQVTADASNELASTAQLELSLL